MELKMFHVKPFDNMAWTIKNPIKNVMASGNRIRQFNYIAGNNAVQPHGAASLTQQEVFESGYFFDGFAVSDIRDLSVGQSYTITLQLSNGHTLSITTTKTSSDFSAIDLNFSFPEDTTKNFYCTLSVPTWNYKSYIIFAISDNPGYYNNQLMPISVLPYNNDSYYYIQNFSLQSSNYDEMNLFFEGSVLNTEDPYYEADESIPDGGFGDFDYSGDEIDFPDLPTISAADSGFVTLYNPTISQIKSLASYLWTGLFDITNFRKIFADPMDCILSLSIVPVAPPATNTAELKVGNIGTDIILNVLSSQFVKVSFAPLNIGLRTNGFMDYSPYTKCELFLPYIGAHSISIDDVAGANVSIEYLIDLFSGACTASVKCSRSNSDGSTFNSVMYQYTGNVVCNIPITSSSYSSFLSSMIGAVAATAVGIATGGAGAAAAGAVSAINTTMSMKPEIERSGNLSSASGFLGRQKPYLILTYPNLCRPVGREKTVGTPSFLGLSSNKKLKMFHGFTRLHKINITGLPCTELEKNMIASELMEGVILP